MGKGTFRPVVPAGDIPEKDFSCFQVDGVPIVVCRFRDEYFAVENKCSHALSAFDDGCVRGYRLICPLHGAAFDFRDGLPVSAPAKRAIETFPVRVVDGVVEVDVSGAG
ncbi:MAG: Rieske 2Fe-2S domain-containing protein [Gammaproteobacteria bacterium]|nr:Rieske 2Fe-2S domain-containing protein [Gammaproteobacteria bacterium]